MWVLIHQTITTEISNFLDNFLELVTAKPVDLRASDATCGRTELALYDQRGSTTKPHVTTKVHIGTLGTRQGLALVGAET